MATDFLPSTQHNTKQGEIKLALKAIHNESDLLKEVEKGDEKAFKEIFMAYHHHLAAYVMMLTESKELTEEIIQDVFIKIWDGRENLHQVKKFTAYLFILTRNYTLNALRKLVSEREKEQHYVNQIRIDEIQTATEEETEPDFRLLINKAVVQLPPQQKKVFVLRMQGFKNHQIASEMQISPASVKKYQQWALKSVINYVRISSKYAILFLILRNNLEIVCQVFLINN